MVVRERERKKLVCCSTDWKAKWMEKVGKSARFGEGEKKIKMFKLTIKLGLIITTKYAAF